MTAAQSNKKQIAFEKFAYTLEEAALAVGKSKRSLMRAHEDGNLNFIYQTPSIRHPSIDADELKAWVKSWPDTPDS